MLLLIGIIVFGTGILLLNKALGYTREVDNNLADSEVMTRGPKHWEMVEISRSSTRLMMYSIGIMLVGVALVVLYF